MGDKTLSPEEIEALINNAGDSGTNGINNMDKDINGADAGNTDDGNTTTDAGENDNYDFSSMDLDILGEVYNMSMGAAANAVSSLLRMKVDITSPIVVKGSGTELVYQSLEPAVGVEIKYVSGIEGINVFILSQLDVMKIVDIWMGGAGVIDENAEFNDMHISAIGELMNQMMGSSSMALADVLNTQIDISSPVTYKIEGDFSPANKVMKGKIIIARFKFIVGDIINSEMITTCTLDFAKSMIDMAKKSFGIADGSNARVQEIIAETTEQEPQQYSKEASQPSNESMSRQNTKNSQNSQNNQNNQNNQNKYNDNYSNQNTNINQPPKDVHSVSFANFDSNDEFGGAYVGNMDLVLDLPLDVTVEIGRTKKAVHDVLEFGEGSIITLDKQVAEPVDIFVNGNLVAKGSVVVIEENFGVRITEIVSTQDKIKAAKNK